MREELRAVAWRALGYFVVLELMLAAAVLFWPDFEENLDALRGMAPMKVLQDLVDRIGDEGVAAYVNGQHFFKGCNTLGSAAAVFFAMGAVAGEAHRGTLELWLARPFSRRRLLAQRFVAGALALIVPVFATTATVPFLLARIGEELDLARLLLCAAHQSAFLLAIYALAFFYSCCSTKPAQIAFVMLALSTLEFSIYMVQVATHWSVFRLSDVEVYQELYSTGAFDPVILLPLLATTIVLCIASDRVFARRTP